MYNIKNIQTKIDMYRYYRLLNISKYSKKTLKETLLEAIDEYLNRQEKKLINDPMFKIVASFKTTEGVWSERKDWKE